MSWDQEYDHVHLVMEKAGMLVLERLNQLGSDDRVYGEPNIDLYTKSRAYMLSTIRWHLGMRKKENFREMVHHVGIDESVLEVGCANCTTGLSMILYGYKNVTFCDFEGLAHEIASGVVPEREFIPYGKEVGRSFDWVVAFDVLEHVPNPLYFVRWVWGLCKKGIVLTFPLINPIPAPYEPLVIDNAIDVELLLSAIDQLFVTIYAKSFDGGFQVVALKREIL